MKFYAHKRHWKIILLLIAISIGVLSLRYTNQLVKKMKNEERKKMELWAEATKYLSQNEEYNQNVSIYLTLIQNNTTIPVLLTIPTESGDSIISYSNLNPKKAYLAKTLRHMKETHEPIIINFLDDDINNIYYDDSTILKQLAIYPYVQLGIISIFIFIAYLAFSSSRKAEQNQVWVGMSKETAHQLGTPISSLIAWIEILDQTEENASYIAEMEKDVVRLQMITERFSKIGSIPDLPLTDLQKSLDGTVRYMQTRISKHVEVITNYNTIGEVILPLNASLFHWVIENLMKNAVDAMNGKGKINIYLVENIKEATILVTDSGKGISKNKQKTIFKPGYTSKERGWGLGLSLAKRIIENYHNGKILVQDSELNEGTTFKIILPK